MSCADNLRYPLKHSRAVEAITGSGLAGRKDLGEIPMKNTIPDMQGKVCLITGATNGIGRVTAEVLARSRARVVIVGRDAQRTESAVADIRQRTGSEQVEYLVGDLSIQAQVRQIAQNFRRKYDRLDVLINNAGGIFMQRKLSADGIEMTFALNHLAYFYLTHELLDLLKRSAPARIVNVSSAAHVGGRIQFDDLANPRTFRGWKAYSQSKLANVLFTYELSRRLAGTGVTANVLHPGFVATNFGRSNGGLFNLIFRLSHLVAVSPEKGAETILYLAASPEVEGVTGKYFDQCKEVRSSAASYDLQTAQRLWAVSLEMTGLAKDGS
jgi:retinol dehydrogenase 12